jgi:hypothetical protein
MACYLLSTGITLLSPAFWLRFSPPETSEVQQRQGITVTAKWCPTLPHSEADCEDEDVSKSFRSSRVERELQMVQFPATRCSCIAILWVILTSFAVISLCVASQWVFIIIVVVIDFVIDSVRIYSRICVTVEVFCVVVPRFHINIGYIYSEALKLFEPGYWN